MIELGEFCERAGLVLAPDAVVVDYGGYVRQRQEDDAPRPAQDPPVGCWHAEPDSPCDWDVCRQPERFAAGDRGTDPASATPYKETR